MGGGGRLVVRPSRCRRWIEIPSHRVTATPVQPTPFTPPPPPTCSLQTILHSLGDIVNIIMLLLIVMFIFSIVGISFFATAAPEHFGSLPDSMFTLFVLVTQDGWVDVFRILEVFMHGWFDEMRVVM